MAFILDKIPGAQTNAPELFLDIPCGKTAETSYLAGDVVCVKNGALEFSSLTDPGEYIIVEDKKTNGADDKVKCFKTLPGMVFKANAVMSEPMKVGYRGGFVHMASGTRFVATSGVTKGAVIVSMNGYENAQPMYPIVVSVMFDRV